MFCPACLYEDKNKYGSVQELRSTFSHIKSIYLDFSLVWFECGLVNLYVGWMGQNKADGTNIHTQKKYMMTCWVAVQLKMAIYEQMGRNEICDLKWNFKLLIDIIFQHVNNRIPESVVRIWLLTPGQPASQQKKMENKLRKPSFYYHREISDTILGLQVIFSHRHQWGKCK